VEWEREGEGRGRGELVLPQFSEFFKLNGAEGIRCQHGEHSQLPKSDELG
jgi:hypothetical protein